LSPPEPKVVTEDVQAILLRTIRPEDPDQGEAVALIAELASTSTRTIYRILGRESKTLDLGLADRVVMAAGSHLDQCRLALPDGRVVDYLEG
jgi:hypothetical protein